MSIALVLLLWSGDLSAQQPADGWDEGARAFVSWAAPLAGAYRLDGGEHLIVTPHTDFRVLSLFWLERGDVRALERTEPGRFRFGHGLYVAEPYAGSIEFVPAGSGEPERLRLRVEGSPERTARRVPMLAEPVSIDVDGRAELAGLLVTPPGAGPFPAAVVLPSGYNDRYHHWRLAMALLTRGVASIVFDARRAGESTGESLPAHYYQRSLIRAEDGAAVARWIRSHPRIDPQRTGVLGWSQGGWLGSVIAGRDPEVAFYVNIAGNLNPGWQQARHARLSDLLYEGFAEHDIAAAQRYLDAYYGVMAGALSWSEYEAALETARQTPWLEWLVGQGFDVVWSSPEEAAAYARRERDNIPEDDVARVAQPALGIYFEFDESSPPESAEIFLRALGRAGNPDVLLRKLPRTSHGGWVVRGLQREEDAPPTRLAPEIFRLVMDWVTGRVGGR